VTADTAAPWPSYILKILNQRIAGPSCRGKGRASPVITLLSILLHWIRTLKELQSSSKADRYGFKFDISPWQRGRQGGQLRPQGLLLEREEPTTAKSQSQWSHSHDTESSRFLRVSQCH
jgi:hypothetical protein